MNAFEKWYQWALSVPWWQWLIAAVSFAIVTAILVWIAAKMVEISGGNK